MTLSYLPFSRTVYRERSKLEERVERTRQRKNKIGSPFDFIFLSAIVDDTSPLRPRSPRLVFAPAPRLAASHPLQTRTSNLDCCSPKPSHVFLARIRVIYRHDFVPGGRDLDPRNKVIPSSCLFESRRLIDEKDYLKRLSNEASRGKFFQVNEISSVYLEK